MIAHVAGVPLEESLLPLLSGVGTGLLLARAWVGSRLRMRRVGSPRRPRSGVEDGASPRP